MKKLPFLIIAFIVCQSGIAQNSQVVKDYINTYREIAIEEMLRTGVPASITLAQGIHETSAGQSVLVKKSNNHFGIKCKSDWKGESVSHDDDARGECFRKYEDPFQSYRDHSDFLKNSQRYAFLFNINPEHYKEWAKGLKKAGYATNPKYWQQLVKYIDDYDLNLYTLVALGKKQMSDESAYYAMADMPATAAPAVVNTVITAAAGSPSGMNELVNVAAAEPVRAKYPEGEFKINDTKVIVVFAGTPLLSIAEQRGMRYKHLLDFNDIEEGNDFINKDQLIFLQRKRKQGNTGTGTA